MFVEGLWRSMKDEEVYLKFCVTLAKAKRELAIYF
jgi:hypothetical protein